MSTAAAILALASATDFGTDVALARALGASWGIASDQANLSNAIFRRLTCPKGALIYATDYGIDVRTFLNATMGPAQLAQMRSAIVAEVEKDPRVQSASAVLTLQSDLLSVRVVLTIETATGPFDLIFAVSELSVERLGRTLAETVPEAPTTTGVVIEGPPGPPGPQGPSGGGGGAGGFVIDQSAQMAVGDTTERVVYEAEVDFTGFGGTVTFELIAQIAVASGTGTYRLRLGGTTDTADGTVLITRTTTNSAPTPTSGTATAANPTGLARVKVTAQNSVLNQDATIRDLVVTLA